MKRIEIVKRYIEDKERREALKKYLLEKEEKNIFEEALLALIMIYEKAQHGVQLSLFSEDMK